MNDPVAPTTEELHAYADRRLDPARRAQIEAWLAAHAEDTARVADYARINGDLHGLFDPILAEPVPAEMQTLRARRRPLVASIAGAAACLALGAIGGWVMRDSIPQPPVVQEVPTPPPLSSQAAIAHQVYVGEVRHPVEVAANEEQHLVAWLSKRMGRSIRAPRLEASGYRLVGGRLLPAAEGGVASQFMYERADGNRLTLFVKAAPVGKKGTAFHFVEREDIGVFYWLDGPLGYALAGSLGREELLLMARQVYEQLNS